MRLGLEWSRLRWPEWVVGIGGLVLLFALFVPGWYTVPLPSPPPKYFTTESLNGWHGVSVLRWLLLLTILASFALAFFQARQRAPALPVAFAVIATLLAGVSLIWLIVRVWIAPHGGRGIGGWIGLLSAAAIVYGGYWSLRTEGIAPADAPTEIPTVGLGGEQLGGEGST